LPPMPRISRTSEYEARQMPQSQLDENVDAIRTFFKRGIPKEIQDLIALTNNKEIYQEVRDAICGELSRYESECLKSPCGIHPFPNI
jgi:hypothetical protein